MFQKQPIMRKVLYSLAPIFLFSIYLYGLRPILTALVVFPLGVAVEYLFEKKRGKKVSEAVLVTCALYTLSMPPVVPLWIVAVGIVFAVFMAKEVYGGFGRNIFNVAIAGRLFVYISFATILQAGFVEPGAFGASAGLWGYPVDGMTAATPLAQLRQGEPLSVLNAITGFRMGSMGESSVILILLAAIYLIATKTASWRLIASTIGSAVLLNGALLLAGVSRVLPMESLLVGSFLYVAVFMATDPVTAPKKPLAQWLYGTVIGVSVVLIRSFALFPEGTSFAVLLANTAASMFDDLVTGKKPKAATAPQVPAAEKSAPSASAGAQKTTGGAQ
ncbi:RnfABCDGE type electron transport complex subunit D [Gracilinema caldarium]|uniref:NQR2 and RnfD family protein n=1 Tax=Gracilinema caldarium (strain ATCC 51460 / DSM 7334 / H1) TaxID=744872 RepID=F8F2W1_GRAC1|nr:RnfABCDGE type electron transport complex subunit D [Gracilinema caldarium]AEJ19869.1 NQR2 and RnfD family protein [Gracilinema caldarium DSM 7334]